MLPDIYKVQSICKWDKKNKNQLLSMLKENIDQNRAALGLDAGVDLSGLDPIYTSYLTNKECIVKELTPDHGTRPMWLIGESKLEDIID